MRTKFLKALAVTALAAISIPAASGSTITLGDATVYAPFALDNGTSENRALTGSGTTTDFALGQENFVPGGSVNFFFFNSIGTFNQSVPGDMTIQSVPVSPLSYSAGLDTAGITAFAGSSPSPSVSQSASLSASNDVINSQLDLTYLLEVVSASGATGTANITVDSTGTASASTGGITSQDATSEALLTILGVLTDNVTLEYACANDSCGNSNSVQGAGVISQSNIGFSGSSESGGFNESGTYSINVGEVYEVELETDLRCGDDTSCSVSASVDPVITLDSSSSDLSLAFSPGMGDSAAAGTPEPSTWALMLFGLIGVSFAARFRARKRADSTLA